MGDIMFELLRLKAKGLCCSQIILTLALEAQGKTNADLVRSIGGLCFGIGGNGEVCGALSGSACLLSFYAGKGSGEEPHDRYPMMLFELVSWFQEAAASTYGGMKCDEILQKFPDRSICGRIVADTYEKCMDILARSGLDPTVDRYGPKGA